MALKITVTIMLVIAAACNMLGSINDSSMGPKTRFFVSTVCFAYATTAVLYWLYG